MERNIVQILMRQHFSKFYSNLKQLQRVDSYWSGEYLKEISEANLKNDNFLLYGNIFLFYIDS